MGTKDKDFGEESKPPPETERPVESGDGPKRPREIGGRAGPDPTRFGDWEKNGRCIDF